MHKQDQCTLVTCVKSFQIHSVQGYVPLQFMLIASCFMFHWERLHLTCTIHPVPSKKDVPAPCLCGFSHDLRLIWNLSFKTFVVAQWNELTGSWTLIEIQSSMNISLPACFCQTVTQCKKRVSLWNVNWPCCVCVSEECWITWPVCVGTVLSADCSGGSDLTMSPEERVPMRRSSTREQDHRSGGTCFLLAASDYTCPTDGGLRKTGNCMSLNFIELKYYLLFLQYYLIKYYVNLLKYGWIWSYFIKA